jgi:plastocyanin
MRSRTVGSALVLAAVLVTSGSAATTAEVTMPGKFYAPHDLDVLVGTTVTWHNTDRTTHTVTEDDDAFDSGHIRPGDSFSTTFAKSGTFRFHCTIHRFMRGSIGVFEVVLRGPAEPLPAGRRARLAGIAPAGVESVQLIRLSPGEPTAVARATPGPDGAFQFLVRAPEPRYYRVRAGSATSPVVRVRVAPRVAIARRTSGIKVHAVPARPGSRVVLQEYDRELFAFVTVARGRLDASSQATIAYAPTSLQHVRAVVLGRDGWSDGASRPLVVGTR